MRLVRFEDPSGALALDLHPLLTVISGLPAHARDRLIAAVTALPRGGDPGGVGTIEVHGVYMELSKPSLELLELHQDLDVVLGARDLPGAESRLPADTGTDAFLANVTTSSTQQSSDARAVGERTVASLRNQGDELTRDLSECHDRLRVLSAERAALDHRVALLRDTLDPFAAAAAKVARDEFEAARERARSAAAAAAVSAAASDAAAAATAAPPADTGPSVVDLERRIAERQAAVVPLRSEAERLRSIDPEPVRRALDQLQRGAQSVWVPSPDAERLLHEWRSYLAQRSSFESRRSGGRNLLAEVSTRRDRAYDEFVDAERTLRAPTLDTKLVDELEMVHDELFELDGRTGKIGGSKLRRRLEELRVHESRLLTQLGFDTWSAYVMGVSAGGADMQRSHRFQVAQAAYQLAEDELARVAAGSIQDEGELRELGEREAGLRRRIAALLGHEPEPNPDAELRAVRLEQPAVGGSDRNELAAELRARLTDTGATLAAGELGVDELGAVASGWLDAMSALPERMDEIRSELQQIERDVEALNAQRAELLVPQSSAPPVTAPPVTAPPVTAPSVTAPSAWSDELGMAQERVDDAERRLEAHEQANIRVGSMHAEAAELARRDAETRLQINDVESRVRDHERETFAAQQRVLELDAVEREQAERDALETQARADAEARLAAPAGGSTADAEAIEWYVLARLAQQRSVSFVGSVPLMVSDAFAGWAVDDLREVFGRLERMSEVIQIIYLTDDPGVISWSRSLGEERARVIELAASV